MVLTEAGRTPRELDGHEGRNKIDSKLTQPLDTTLSATTLESPPIIRSKLKRSVARE